MSRIYAVTHRPAPADSLLGGTVLGNLAKSSPKKLAMLAILLRRAS